MKKTPLLTELELELMQIIWANDDVSVEFLRQQLADNGRPLALPSIRTMLSILKKKGFVSRRQVSRAYVYNAAIAADDFQQNFIRDALNRAFSGSATGLFTALLNRDLVSESELKQIKAMISDYEGDQKK
ncbi:MAG: BlaI/MecI/CopY family transcriptional regulator [Pseudomonadales bacterium]|nr:BlaI/MecI/CopY family transcriptional regulator [Pseudomonadales bacterium]